MYTTGYGILVSSTNNRYCSWIMMILPWNCRTNTSKKSLRVWFLSINLLVSCVVLYRSSWFNFNFFDKTHHVFFFFLYVIFNSVQPGGNFCMWFCSNYFYYIMEGKKGPCPCKFLLPDILGFENYWTRQHITWL